MLTTTIKISQIENSNVFKNAVWRQATKEEEEEALTIMSNIKKDL